MGLPAVNRVVVVLVDGLGAAALKSRAGHARTLAGALTAATTIDSGFPTTTASALATLTTGVLPGQHGLVGYSVLDAENDRVVNQLSGWDDKLDPHTWQAQPTVFEQAVGLGFSAAVIGPGRYKGSGFVLLGVNVDEDARKAADVAAKLGVTFPVLLDTDKSVSKLYDLSTMPSTVIIDRDGKVRYVHRGYLSGYEDNYDKQIRELLK